MKRIITIVLILFCTKLYANDAYVVVGGGQVKLSEENKDIEIKSEILTIDLFDDIYSVSVEYVFYNNGPDTTIKTAFPEYKTKEGLQVNYKLKNFEILYGNNESIPYSFIDSETKIADYFAITGWYVKDIFFKSKKETHITINYDADFSFFGSYRSAQYLLGTGNTWKGSLNKLEIIIRNHSKLWIDEVLIGNNTNYNYEYIKDNEYKIYISDFEPNITDEVNIIFSKLPLYYQPPFGITERRFIFKDKILDSDWFNFLNKSQLRILRNSIYAYRGYSFRSSDLQQFFSNEEWYNPNPDFNESNFTNNEKHNIKIISKVEEDIKN